MRLSATSAPFRFVAATLALGVLWSLPRWERPTKDPALLAAGIAQGSLGEPVDIGTDSTASYLPRSSSIGTGTTDIGAAVAARRWLDAGDVPGPLKYRDMAERALLDLRLLTLDSGAFVAAWNPGWRYVWPRDAAFAAAALSATGHGDDARRILGFLARLQSDDGTWLGRYTPEGSAVLGRGVQRDGAGWWLWATAISASPSERLAWWPVIERAADGIATSLDARGLPPVSEDYWERPERTLTLGTAAPLLIGLRAASRMARGAGRAEPAARWDAAAVRLDIAIRTTFGARGFPRTQQTDDRDTAVTFLASPFAPSDPAVARAVRTTHDRLRLPNGGVRPGEGWRRRERVAWTPETALFGLAFAAEGDPVSARAVLDWLDAHRTTLGALPEKAADGRGRPASVAPLGWTAALVLLTLRVLDGNQLGSP